MYGRSRIRRIAKWTGLVVCVMLVAALMVSLRWAVGSNILLSKGGELQVYLLAGRLYIGTDWREPNREPGFYFLRHRSVNRWLPTHYKGTGVSKLFCPIWMLLLPAALPTAYLFYRDRRHPPGHCQRCGYDLTGNESGVCPECGTEVPAP